MTSPQSLAKATSRDRAKAIDLKLKQGQHPGERGVIAHAAITPDGPVELRPIVHRAHEVGPAHERAGWSFLGDLGGDARLPQWSLSDSRKIIGLVVGGDIGVRSVYVRLDHVRVAQSGSVLETPVFAILLEPRRASPLSGWRSA